MGKKEYTAFIFARGGSKGVKNKNIRMLAGKPLIAYSIDAALTSKYIQNVVVSTDSEQIAEVAKKHGAEVLSRPEDLAGDAAPELLAWKHAIDSKRDCLINNSVFISLPATSPLRTTEDVDAAIEKYNATECDLLFGITPSHKSPYLSMVTINQDGLIEVVNPGCGAIRRQDVPTVFDVTSCVYVGNIDYIMSCSSLMEGRVGYIEIPTERAVDIDTEFDLYLADLMLNKPFKLPRG